MTSIGEQISDLAKALGQISNQPGQWNKSGRTLEECGSV
jgi:hypothetical protein